VTAARRSLRAPDVRPYVLTGGRVRAEGDDVRLDTLVQASPAGPAPAVLTTEKRAILAGLAGSYLTVAEIASRLRLPLGVAQVLVADLVAAGALQVHGGGPDDGRYLVLDVLESVFDGISAL
jgi:hypothetical protein